MNKSIYSRKYSPGEWVIIAIFSPSLIVLIIACWIIPDEETEPPFYE